MNFFNYLNENTFNKEIGIEKEIIDDLTPEPDNHQDANHYPNDSFNYNWNGVSTTNNNGGGSNNNGNSLTNQYYNGGRLRGGIYPLYNNRYSNSCGGSMRRFVVCNKRRIKSALNNSRSKKAYLREKRMKLVEEERQRKLMRRQQKINEQVSRLPISQQINNGGFGYNFSNYNNNYNNNFQQFQQNQKTQPLASQELMYNKNQSISEASSEVFRSYNKRNSYNIGNIIDNELKSGNKINLVSVLDKELDKKMETSSVTRSLNSNLDVINTNDFLEGEKKVILNVEDSNYFLSKYTYRKNNYLLTKDSFFFFGFNNIDVDQNKDYYLNIDVQQKFKYSSYPLELMVYGMNKINLLNYFLKIPMDTTVLKFNTKLFNNITLLLYSKKRLYNSVINVKNLELFNYKSKSKGKDINKLTNDIFENINNDNNFYKIYDELDEIFSEKDKSKLNNKINDSLLDCYRRLKGKSYLDRYKENTIEDITETSQYELRDRSFNMDEYNKRKEEENKIRENEAVSVSRELNEELEDVQSINSEDNKKVKKEIVLNLDDGLDTNSNVSSEVEKKSNMSNTSINKDTVKESSNILGDIRRTENRKKNSLFGQLQSQNKKAMNKNLENDFSILSKKLIHEFDFKIENFIKNGTLTLNNNITKNLEIHNLTDHHGYVKFDLEVQKNGNYYVDYTLRDSAFSNVNILATDKKYKNLLYASTSPQLNTIRNFDFFRTQVFFHVTESCGCAGNPDKKVVTIIFYFNVKKKMVASFDNIKIYYIIKPDELKLNKDENNIVHQSVDDISETEEPCLPITNHLRDVNINILYEYNFQDLETKTDIFTFKDVNIGSFHNKANGIIVRPNRDNQVSQIIIKKPILTRSFKVLVELDAFVIGGMNANFIGFDGKEQKFNIPITQTNDTYNKIKFIVDYTTGVLFFGIFFNYLNKQPFNGLVLNNLRICGVDSTYTIRGQNSKTFEYSEERLDGMISDLESKIEGKLGSCL